jgi:hypothetical protein
MSLCAAATLTAVFQPGHGGEAAAAALGERLRRSEQRERRPHTSSVSVRPLNPGGITPITVQSVCSA